MKKFVLVALGAALISGVVFAAPESAQPLGRSYALIISANKTARFVETVAEVYRPLQKLGFSKKDIRVLEDPLGFQHNMYPTVGGATAANVRRELRRLAEIARPRDSVVVHFCDHGDLAIKEIAPPRGGCPPVVTMESVLCLDDGVMPASELQSFVRNIHAKVLVTLDCCYSGGIAKAVASEDVTAVAASGSYELSYNYGTDTFHCLFYRYLAHCYSFGDWRPIDAREAFAWACRRCDELQSLKQHPEFHDNFCRESCYLGVNRQ